MQQLDYNLLFRWFVSLSMDASVWDATTFSKNRDRLLDAEITRKLLAAILAQPRVAALISDEHFSVDGTLIQAWANHNSFKPKDASAPGGSDDDLPVGRNAERDFRGEKRSNETHASTLIPVPGWLGSPTTPRPSWPMPGTC